MSMKWLGLTGGIATGKSTVAGLLRHAGISVICADQLAREAVQPETSGFAQVVKEFGNDIVSPDGSLDRKALGKKVFGSPARLSLLESIIHPEVRRLQREKREALEKTGEIIAVYDVPLLFEKNLQGDYDAIIVVACSPQNQLLRLMKRDGITEEDAQKRIASQLPIEQKAKAADFLIQNDLGQDELRATVARTIEQIQKRFSKR